MTRLGWPGSLVLVAKSAPTVPLANIPERGSLRVWRGAAGCDAASHASHASTCPDTAKTLTASSRPPGSTATLYGYTPSRSRASPVDLPQPLFNQDSARFAHDVQKRGRRPPAPQQKIVPPAPPFDRGGRRGAVSGRPAPWRHSQLGISDRRRTSALLRAAQRGRD